MNVPNNIPNGLLINAQANLNPKVQFATLALLGNLGTGDVFASMYYEHMVVYCVENKNWYIWREKETPDAVGVIGGDFTYATNFVSFGVTYSGRTFNFFPIHNGKNITPYGVLNIKKISSSTTDEVLEAGDYVVNTVLTNNDYLIFGIYVSGDAFLEASYNSNTIQILKPTA